MALHSGPMLRRCRVHSTELFQTAAAQWQRHQPQPAASSLWTHLTCTGKRHCELCSALQHACALQSASSMRLSDNLASNCMLVAAATTPGPERTGPHILCRPFCPWVKWHIEGGSRRCGWAWSLDALVPTAPDAGGAGGGDSEEVGAHNRNLLLCCVIVSKYAKLLASCAYFKSPKFCQCWRLAPRLGTGHWALGTGAACILLHRVNGKSNEGDRCLLQLPSWSKVLEAHVRPCINAEASRFCQNAAGWATGPGITGDVAAAQGRRAPLRHEASAVSGTIIHFGWFSGLRLRGSHCICMFKLKAE